MLVSIATNQVGRAATVVIIALMFAVAIWTTVFWIIRLVEVWRLPASQYRAGRKEKVVWITVVVLGGLLGALVWHFAGRHRVLSGGIS